MVPSPQNIPFRHVRCFPHVGKLWKCNILYGGSHIIRKSSMDGGVLGFDVLDQAALVSPVDDRQGKCHSRTPYQSTVEGGRTGPK